MHRFAACHAYLLLAVSVVGMSISPAAEPLRIEVKRKPGDKNWKSLETWTLAHADGFQPRNGPAKLTDFGGDPSHPARVTGFFHPEKIGDRWWLVDPQGGRFVHVAMGSVSPATGSAKAKAAFEKKFGSHETWAARTTEQLRTNGFNGSGAWSKDALLAQAPRRLAYCPNWNFMSSYGRKRGGTYQKPGHTGYPNDAIFVFDPGFESFAMEHAEALAATKDDPWLLGHFSDNELPLGRKCLDRFLGLPKGDHGSKAAWEWLRKRKGETAGPESITDSDREAFREAVIERYFAIVSKAIKTHDPNHLYLGCRFHGDEKNSQGAFRAAGKYADVISVNLYGVWTPNRQLLDHWVKWSGKPFLITEFYAKGEDSGMPNHSGAGWLVKTQKERGLFYQNFCLALLQSKGCVGWHYFKYQDNDPDNHRVDPSNRDSNKGIVTATFDEHADCLQPMKELNLNVHALIDWIDQGGKLKPGPAN